MDTLELPIVDASVDAGASSGDTARIGGASPTDITQRLDVVVATRAEASPDDGRRRRRAPHDRPPLSLRLFAGLGAFGALLATAALLLSDRAPGVLRVTFGDRARRLWERIDAGERARFATEAELPATDFIVHVAIWTVVAVLVGLAVWSWRGLLAAAVLLGAASVALELGQGRYATTRAVEGSDMLANLIGLGVGISVAAACYLTWSTGAALVRRVAGYGRHR